MATKFFTLSPIIGLALFFSSCSSSEDFNQELTANSCRTQELGTYKYSVCLSAPEQNNLSEESADILQFVVKISRIGSKNNPIFENGEEMVPLLSNYFSYEVSQDMILSDGESSVQPVVLNLIRNYNASPYVELLVTFDSSDLPNEAQTLLINDRKLGGTLVKFPIKLKA